MRALKQRFRCVIPLILTVAAMLSPTGCAIHYFDPETGTEHLWGFGHLKMKVATPSEGLRAIVRGTETIGIALGTLERQSYLHVGFQSRHRLDVVDEDTAVRFEWPTNDFFDVRVGSQFPREFVEEASASDKATDEG